ncbi:MAG: LysR family transcriptional regulator [Castellaniella sp.]|uniref:LysR family transcriptional regulator n=1 Tax=Castellaniella sp. TaxID=1955812 RepID=UPI0011F8F7AB|nr:LysR family transcriptional regulator [Castellaniella sp.]TAN26333.1 MAG: LysR family transcriptional regulator [Castellaniella sp.]
MKSLDLYANDLILFAHIVDAGSFTTAADRLGLPNATLSRRLSSLENIFGERLIHRTTRRLMITEFGKQMLVYARHLVDGNRAAEDLVLHRQATPQGTLRVSMPPEFHEISLVKILSKFTAKYPDVRLDLDLSARRVDLIAERFDLAVRVATRLPDDGSLVARHILTQQYGLYASPAYLRRFGTPASPADLVHHVGLVVVSNSGDHRCWHLTHGEKHWDGRPERVMTANSLGLLEALSIEGMGIIGLSDHFAHNPMNCGTLQRVLPNWLLPASTIWCVTPGRRLLPQRTLAFMEILGEVLRPVGSRALRSRTHQPWLQGAVRLASGEHTLTAAERRPQHFQVRARRI